MQHTKCCAAPEIARWFQDKRIDAGCSREGIYDICLIDKGTIVSVCERHARYLTAHDKPHGSTVPETL